MLKIMKDFNEKRNAERFYLKAPIKYSTTYENEAHNAYMFNCSEGGLYFETGSPLRPGADVVVSGVEKNRFFRASIKWCKRVGPVDRKIYGIGAEYYD
jgi:Tfp pilus assembly protein PilZ